MAYLDGYSPMVRYRRNYLPVGTYFFTVTLANRRSTALNEDDCARHVDYIHINPVKHGLVSSVAGWPHSLFHRVVRSSHLPMDWAGTVTLDAEGFGERA